MNLWPCYSQSAFREGSPLREIRSNHNRQAALYNSKNKYQPSNVILNTEQEEVLMDGQSSVSLELKVELILKEAGKINEYKMRAFLRRGINME